MGILSAVVLLWVGFLLQMGEVRVRVRLGDAEGWVGLGVAERVLGLS